MNPSTSSDADHHNDGMERVLIVGAGEGGRIIARELQTLLRWKLRPVGFVDDDPRKIGREICDIPVLGDTAAIPALVRSEEIDVVIFATPPRRRMSTSSSSPSPRAPAPM